MESAQYSILATNKALELAADFCKGETSYSNVLSLQQRYQYVFAEHITAALNKATQDASKSGRNFDREISRIWQERLLKQPLVFKRLQCERELAEFEKTIGWTLQHYLRLEYADWITRVGNAVGYPCDLSQELAAKAIKKFTSIDIDFSEGNFVSRTLLLADVDNAQKIIVVCDRAQARAPQYGVTDVLDYSEISKVLAMIFSALRSAETDRDQKLNIVKSLARKSVWGTD